MTETHTIRMNIDGSGARKGAGEFTAAINKIAAATKALDKSMSSVSTSVAKTSNFRQIAKDLAALNSASVNPALAKNLTALGAALQAMKAPSATSIKNTRAFLREVERASVNAGVVKSLAAFSQAMASYKGPNAASAKNTRDFFRALSTATINSGLASSMAKFASAMAGYKGPNAAAAKNTQAFFTALATARINPALGSSLAGLATAMAGMTAPSAASARNLQSFITALNSLRIPQGLGALPQMMALLAANMNRTSGAARSMGGAIGGIPFARANAGAMQLTGGLRGLENAMSVSYQLGSQLRTLFGALTVSGFTSGMYDASLAAEQFRAVLGVTIKSASEVDQVIEASRATANRFGLDMKGMYREYGAFITSARLSGASIEELNYIFENVSGAMRVLGRDAYSQQLTWKALTQMFSKGKISAEELRQQLSEQLPGSFELLQSAIREFTGDYSTSLDELMKQGKVGAGAITLFAQRLQEEFGDSFTKAMMRVDSHVARLKNTWFDFLTIVGNSDALDAIGEVSARLSEAMDQPKFKQLAQDIGEGLGNAIRSVGDAVLWAMENIDMLAKGLGYVLGAKLAQSIGNTIVQVGGLGKQLFSLVGFGGMVGTALGGAFVVAGAALALHWNDTVKLGNTYTTVGGIAQVVFQDLVRWAGEAGNSVLTAATDMLNAIAGFFTGADSMLEGNKPSWVDWGDAIIATINYVGDSLMLVVGGAIKGIAYEISGLIGLAAQIPNGFQAMANFSKGHNEGRNNALVKWYEDAQAARAKYEEGGQPGKGPVTNYLAGLELAIAKQKELDALSSRTPIKDLASGYALPENPGSSLDVILGGDEDDAKAVGMIAKAAKDAKDAIEDFVADSAALKSMLASGKITNDQYAQSLEFISRALEETVDPYAALVRSIEDENNILRLNTDEQDVARKVMQTKNDLLAKGVALTDEQVAALEKLYKTQEKLNDQEKNSPFQKWVSDIKDFGAATDEVAIKALDGLSSEIADLVVDGKADFASLSRSILKEFIKVGINQVFKALFGGNGQPAQPQMPSSLPTATAAMAAAGYGAAVDPVTGAPVKSAAGSLVYPGHASSFQALSQGYDAPVTPGWNQASTNTFGQKQGALATGFDSFGEMRTAAEEGARAGSQQGAKEGAQTGARDGAQTGAQEGTRAGAREGVQAGMDASSTAIAEAMTRGINAANISQQVATGIQQGFAAAQGSPMFGSATGMDPVGGSTSWSQMQQFNSGATPVTTGSIAPVGAMPTPNARSVAPVPVQIRSVAPQAAPSFSPVAQMSPAGQGTWSTGGNFRRQGAYGTLDPRIENILKQTALSQSKYDVMAISGGRSASGKGSHHQRGNAMDIQLTDRATGRVLNNYQNAGDFLAYEQFAQQARQTQLQMHPELNDKFRWGGYFSGGKGKYGALDSMHFDTAGTPTGGGSWAGGLTQAQKGLWPGIQSQGMGQYANQIAPGGAAAFGGGQVDQSAITGSTAALQQMNAQIQQMPAPINQTVSALQQQGTSTTTLGTNAQMVGTNLQTVGTGLQQSGEAAQQSGQAHQQAAQQIQAAAQQAQSAGGSVSGFGAAVANTGSAASGAQGGLGGVIQMLMQMAGGFGGGGGGGMGGILGMVGGLFGGFESGGTVGRGAPQTFAAHAKAFNGAPSMKVGGIVGDPNAVPIIAHRGELVTPKHQVEQMKRLGQNAAMFESSQFESQSTYTAQARATTLSDNIAVSASSRKAVEDAKAEAAAARAANEQSDSPAPAGNLTFVLHGVKDADSFRRSEGQIKARLHSAQQRAAQKNN